MSHKTRAGEIASVPPKTPIADAIFNDTKKGVATPVRRNKSTLIELLAMVNKKNLHADVDLDSPVGREIW
jgi:antitoxin component of MazEF toxin-antitoxin module